MLGLVTVMMLVVAPILYSINKYRTKPHFAVYINTFSHPYYKIGVNFEPFIVFDEKDEEVSYLVNTLTIGLFFAFITLQFYPPEYYDTKD